MINESLNLAPKTVGEIYKIVWPNLEKSQQAQFLGLTRSWGSQTRKINALNRE